MLTNHSLMPAYLLYLHNRISLSFYSPFQAISITCLKLFILFPIPMTIDALLALTCSILYLCGFGNWHGLCFSLQDNAISTRSTLFLLMANILNGMTHLSIDIQLMAFRFLELVVLNFPSSFCSYAEQVSALLSCLLYWLVNDETPILFWENYFVKRYIV